MNKLSFALYGTQSQFIESISPILKDFEQNYGSTIDTTGLSIDDAWPQLLQYTIYGGGPDLARIGTIWTSSLISLNALRPFKESEVAGLGGEDAFYKSIWQGIRLPDDSNIWAIPFTAFNYVIFYRKDFLSDVGIDIANAFISAQAMYETLEILSASHVQSPWIIPSGEHFRARLHILASWIWGAGGHFLSEDGKEVLLDQQEALAGLKSFFELHHFLAHSDYGLSPNECRRRFARGQATMFIGGPDTLRFLRDLNPAPGVIENIGVAALPGTPWIGGSSLVVWKDVLMDPLKERAVNGLISYLTDKTTQERIFEYSNVLPARSDALPGLILDPLELLDIEKLVLQSGRSYRPYPIWVRIQNDLIHVLDQIAAEFLDDTTKDVLPIIQKHIDPVVQRYSLILGGM